MVANGRGGKSKARRDEPFDPAALAGAAVAGAIAVQINPGPYNVMSVVIGATLLTIISAYENNRRRGLRQSCALGAVAGFVALLPVGFCLEWWLGRRNLNGICKEAGGGSRVPPCMLWAAWLIIAVSVVVVDVMAQSPRRGGGASRRVS